MKKVLILFLFFPIFEFTEGQNILTQDYSFLGTDGEVSKIRQSNDTLYYFHCYIDRPCQPNPESHSKILGYNTSGDFTIFKLEGLDSIPLTTDPYPETRYSLLALKTINSKQLGVLPLKSGLTRQQIDTIKTDIESLKDKFFFTYFSNSYLMELSTLKKVTTMEDAEAIIDFVKSGKFTHLVERYSKTKIFDLYGSGFSAELLNRACIEKGYNPIGAGRSINNLMREKKKK